MNNNVLLSAPLKICVHDFSGHPFQIQLSRELAKRGFETEHAYCKDILGARGNLQLNKDDPAGLTITGLSTGKRINRYNFLKRLLDEQSYGRTLTNHLKRTKPDLVILSNTPIDSLTPVIKHCQQHKIPTIIWLQDILGLAAKTVLQQKLGLLGIIIGNYYISRERKLLRKADAIVSISDDFSPTLKKWKITENKITVIENWAPLEELPIEPRSNEWSKKNKLNEHPIALYSGALGLKHNPKLLLDLAKELNAKMPNARLVVISEGYGANWLKAENEHYKLESLILLPFQKFNELPKVLASANALLAILEPEAGKFCVPSKVLSYMCAGRPIVLAASEENLASRLLTKNNAGIVTSPKDTNKFSTSVRHLLESPQQSEELGKNARSYAEKSFNVETITDKFLDVIRTIVGRKI